MSALSITRLSTGTADFDARLDRLLAWDVEGDGSIEQQVAQVLADVRSRGDDAVIEYTNRFDDLQAASMDELRIPVEALSNAWQAITDDERRALSQAYDRIRNYHEHQAGGSWSFTDNLGNELGQTVTPLARVGVYVPGGQAAYPSTVLMTLGPARVAGVDELVVTVPTPRGKRSDIVLAALSLVGVEEVWTIGGAQAVAALAYGTPAIERVDKIVGPGGAYVAAAKRQVFGRVGIDVIAGPSEVAVVADGTTPVDWVALDLFSQAEHDAAAQSILLSPDADYLEAVYERMNDLLPSMQRRDTIRASLEQRGALVHTRDLDEAVAVVNRIAPEHLELQVADPESLLPNVRHAGAVFCGAYSGESFGDYVAGPSHVLPTFGTARFASPLGVYDFQKRSSVMRISAEGAAALADVAVPLANSEGLEAHARAAALRATDSN